MISSIKKFFRTALYDPVNDRQLEIESNGGLPVNTLDQATRPVSLPFIKALATPTTIIADTAVGDTSITVASTTGFADGVVVGLFSGGGTFYFAIQIGAAVGNVINLDTPLDKVYLAGSNCLPANDNLAVDGSTTPQVFQIGPIGSGSDTQVDVTRLMGYIGDKSAMDDSMFGGIPALTYGCVLRYRNSYVENIWNVKSNGEIGLICSIRSYTEPAPSGDYGMNFVNTYSGRHKHGVVIRLHPGDTLELLIQDDLTGLNVFRMLAQGHIGFE